MISYQPSYHNNNKFIRPYVYRVSGIGGPTLTAHSSGATASQPWAKIYCSIQYISEFLASKYTVYTASSYILGRGSSAVVHKYFYIEVCSKYYTAVLAVLVLVLVLPTVLQQYTYVAIPVYFSYYYYYYYYFLLLR